MVREEESLGAKAIGEAIERVERGVLALAADSGARFSYQLNKPPAPENAVEAFLLFSHALNSPTNIVKVERRSTGWALIHEQTTAGRKTKESLLRDAAIDVRQQFLSEVSAFAASYREQVDAVLALRDADEAAGRSALANADDALRILNPPGAPAPQPETRRRVVAAPGRTAIGKVRGKPTAW